MPTQLCKSATLGVSPDSVALGDRPISVDDPPRRWSSYEYKSLIKTVETIQNCSKNTGTLFIRRYYTSNAHLTLQYL